MTNESTITDPSEEENKAAFLESNIFLDLENQHKGIRDKSKQYFSEEDFKKVLERAAYYGIGIYNIYAFRKKKPFDTVNHEDYNKKATHPKWYSNAFIHLKKREKEMLYAADYRVTKKLLSGNPKTMEK
ncbi:hypothetical protein [Ulvibacter antarcticus]|uniref:Uncharacterized protein n=1 Tax=Ulvibacter antarcticus TaxID=442714 RepID=A0A3L9YXJ1_9FLAO|nr:hypothetical protein [Ulvibacter antarcticus]RMA64547.1 hypothetical protein BXY75_1423 [Ulvibacter antarcticus]